MKQLFPPEFMEQLKQKNDIVEVIGSYVKLERRGYTYWACCPFHHEKTPSFAVNASDGYYHCFGCGVSGDVIGFIKNYENVDFRQAVEILAARAGLEVPAYDDRAAEESARRKKKLDRLHLLMRDAARFYLSNLYSGQAQAHLAYTAKRGLSPTIMKKFGLGASLDFRSLPEFLLDRGYTREECLESGACSETNGRLYDSLAGRLIVPIIDQMDEVIAFGGRLLEKSDRAKYKNTRETVLFNKSRTLFNLNQVKKLRRAGGLNSLIMVEGYMDAISLAQAGFSNVVASMGTSLTKDQARLCKRYADDVFISYRRKYGGYPARLIYDKLKQSGCKVFYDYKSMRAGDFNVQLAKAMKSGMYVIAVLTPGCLDEGAEGENYMLKELRRAMDPDNRIRVINVFVDGFSFPAELPQGLEKMDTQHGIYMDAENLDSALERVADVLRRG